MTSEPVRAVLIPVALGAFAAAAQAFIDGANTRGLITAVLGVLIVAAQEYARSQVTPAGAGSRLRDERGYTVVELVVGVLLVAILAVVLLRLL